MNQRVLPIGLFILLAALLVIGCGGGGSSGDSLSSSWLGVKSPSDGSENWQVDIRPAAVAIRPGQTIAMSVFLKNAYGHPVDGVKLLFSSQLGGTFDDTTVETEKGWASNLFTAGKQPGTESIIVIANNYSAAKPILIQSPSVSVPDLKMVTSSDVAQAGNMITVAVGVSIDGVPADDVEVRLASTLPGDFGSESGDAEKGWFTTTFKPDEDIAGVGTLTAMVNGHSVAKAITVVRGQLETPQLTISVNPDSIFQGQTASVIVISKNSYGIAARSKFYGELQNTALHQIVCFGVFGLILEQMKNRAFVIANVTGCQSWLVRYKVELVATRIISQNCVCFIFAVNLDHDIGLFPAAKADLSANRHQAKQQKKARKNGQEKKVSLH